MQQQRIQGSVWRVTTWECHMKWQASQDLWTSQTFTFTMTFIETGRQKVEAAFREGTYCSFKSVNCFSRVVISSRHSILLLSQSSSSISVHMKTWQLWHHLHVNCSSFHQPASTSCTCTLISANPWSKCQLIFNSRRISWWSHVWQTSMLINSAVGSYLRPIFSYPSCLHLQTRRS